MSLKSKLIDSMIGASILVIFPVFAILLNTYLKLQIIKSTSLALIGAGLLGLAIFLFLYSTILFIKIGEGTPVPYLAPKKLVISGIYRHTRNPIYISYALFFLSLFCILGYILLLAYFFASLILLHCFVIFIEEPKLKKRFGTAYTEYMKKTPRWLFK